jgi:phosphotransferase system, enzyme I, PtsP
MLKTMRRIVQEVNSASSIDEALQIVAERVRESMETQACSIFLVDLKTKHLILRATDGLNSDKVDSLSLHPDCGILSLVIKRGEPLNLENSQEHPCYHHEVDLGEDAFKGFLAVPIIHKRQRLGVLLVQQESVGRFDEAEEAFLATVATQLAITLQETDGFALDFDALSQIDNPVTFVKGLGSGPGIGIGQAVIVYPRANLEAVLEKTIDKPKAEILRFYSALKSARLEIQTLGEGLVDRLPEEEQALFDVYLKILDKESLGREVVDKIKILHCCAEFALKKVVDEHVSQFESMEDKYLRERASDIKDLGERILSYLQEDEQILSVYPEKTILVGEEVPVAIIAEVPPEKLMGIVSTSSSSSSHVAILARAMGVPTITGLEGVQVSSLENKILIVDGHSGQLFVSPTDDLLDEYAILEAQEEALDQGLQKIKELPAETLDNYTVNLCVNVGLSVDVDKSLNVGADGVGLYRSEIPFMMRESFPSEETQRIIYRQILAVFSPRTVTMRTLDVGGDKPLPYFPIEEKNPFLGWRGLRLTLDQPEVFIVQIRAMLKASQGYNNLRILFPMVTNLNEIDEALRLVKQAYHEVLDEGAQVIYPQIGVMIEVPSAVYQAKAIAQRVDFLSVGSNDLTQYLLAVDRGNARVANLYDCFHPAVLMALQQVAMCAHAEGKLVSICGEMAGEPMMVPILIAMGFDVLSMNATNLLRAKWVIRHFKMSRAKQMLERVMEMDNAYMIKRYLENALVQANLGNLIRMDKR